MQNLRRTLAGFATIVAIGLLLSIEGPALDHDMGNFDEFRFWMGIETSLSYFFAVAVGAFVARRPIWILASSFAVIGWAIVLYALFRITNVIEPVSFFEIARSNWLSLVFWVVAGIAGAHVGGWYYQHEFRDAAHPE